MRRHRSHSIARDLVKDFENLKNDPSLGGNNEEEEMEDQENDIDNQPLKDFILPKATNIKPGIVPPPIAANNFEIKATLINMVQQQQFGGLPSEDPHLHLAIFLACCDTFKANGVTDDAIRLRLFPFSLRDRARAWIHSIPADSIKTWDELTEVFLAKYFPPSKTSQLRGQIANFGQMSNESLYDAWERFKDLIRICPHHGLAKQYIVQIFYDGLNSNDRNFLDAAAGGALSSKGAKDAFDLIETMAINQHSWNPRVERRTTPGVLELEPMSFMKARLDAIDHKLSELKLSNVSHVTNSLSCTTCNGSDHQTSMCPFTNQENFENVNLVNNYGRSQNNPYAPTFNPGWRNHPNFSYKNNQNTVPQPPNRAQQGFAPQQGFAQQFEPPQPPKSNFETMMEQFMVKQQQTMEEMKETMKQQATQIKMLETQVAQQASSSTRPPGTFPGQPEVNPREHCQAIHLRSGFKYENPTVTRDGKPITQGSAEALEDSSEPLAADSTGEASPKVNDEVTQPNKEKQRYVPPPFRPKVPFPQRLVNSDKDAQYGKFIELLKKLHINVPFIDALTQIPAYAKFLKEILSNKRKIEDCGNAPLTMTCSALLSKSLPTKL